MSTWIDILRAAALGEQVRVGELLHLRLRLELRNMAHDGASASAYEGPIVKAVTNAFKTLDTQSDQKLAESRVDDVVDYITDQIIDKVKRTADLVTFCRMNPDLSIDDIAGCFSGWNNLKRSQSDRVQWILLHLASMMHVGIPLPSISVAVREAADLMPGSFLGFEERALVKKWDVRKSWNAFCKQQELSDNFVCVQESDPTDDVSAESVDFGIVSESRLVSYDSVPDGQKGLELIELASSVAAVLNDLLEDFACRKPKDGFNQIAWHSVWWHFTDKYSGMPLSLRLDQPCCDTDQVLADHILGNYSAVSGVNRLSVQRRRTQLTSRCEGSIIEEVSNYLNR